MRKPGAPYGRDRKDVLLARFVIILDGNAWVLSLGAARAKAEARKIQMAISHAARRHPFARA